MNRGRMNGRLHHNRCQVRAQGTAQEIAQGAAQGKCSLGNVQAIALSILLTLMVLFAYPAIAQAETPSLSPSPSISPSSSNDSARSAQLIPFYPYPPSVWDKFEQVRQDPQLERLVQQDIENSLVVRQVIQDEVDRTFSHTTTLLNVLLAAIPILGIVGSAGLWYLRSSVVNQVMAKTKEQLIQEVERQIAEEAADELKQQTAAFKAEIETLRSEFTAQLAQLRGLASDTEQEKNAIIGKLAEILPLPVREGDSPELHKKVQQLTQKLTALAATHGQLAFSASDYVEQGKALYFEQSYEEALAVLEKARAQDNKLARAALMQAMTLAKLQRFEPALDVYNETLDLKPDLAEAWFGKATTLNRLDQYEAALGAFDRAISLRDGFYQAWFGKARTHAFLGQKEQTLVALKQAIALEGERCREAARTDSAFSSLQNLDDFQVLINT